MNVFDFVLILVLVLFAAVGVWRGLVRELVSLLTWVGAAVAAWTFAGDAAVLFKGVTQEGALRQTLAFVLIFAAVFIAGTVLGFILHRFVNRSSGLRYVNRAAGGVLGFVRGSVVIVLGFLLVGLTSLPQRTAWWRDAALVPLFERAAMFTTRYLPPDIARHVRYG